MKFLVTGNGKSGSWRIRGDQLGRAAGGHVFPRAQTLAECDAIVFVKRYDRELLAAARRERLPIVWDILDAWPQPEGNDWSREEALSWLRRELAAVRPTLVIAATERMAEDLRALGQRSVCIPHHPRSFGTGPIPIRARIMNVGYEGEPHYLGRWLQIAERSCQARGWAFNVNPARIDTMDIMLGIRCYSGHPASAWKSNVKLANAQALGIPFIGSPEAGYIETATPGVELFARNKKELDDALDQLSPIAVRQAIQPALVASARKIELRLIAERYKAAIESVS